MTGHWAHMERFDGGPVAGGVSGTQYRVRVTCGTDSTPAETLVYDILLDWE